MDNDGDDDFVTTKLTGLLCAAWITMVMMVL
jgi:hypothetical protein